METSSEIGEIASALSKAQGVMGGAVKDSKNPFFKSSYANLESVWEACREPLAKNGLAVVQTVNAGDLGIGVTTMLTHSSGQWIKDTMIVHPKDDGPQALGSAITYARRYALAAIAGVYQTDDDAEAAQNRGKVDPRGESYKMEDQVKAQEYAERFRSALQNSKDALLLELDDELHDKYDFYIAVSTYLTAPERSKMKEIIKRERAIRKNGGHA